METTVKNKKLTVLIIGKNNAYQILLKRLLSKSEYVTKPAQSLNDALTTLQQSMVDIILLDLSSYRKNTTLLTKLHQSHPSVPIIVFLKDDDKEREAKALYQGAQECLIKENLSPKAISRTIGHVIERYKILEQIQEERDAFQQLFEAIGSGEVDSIIKQDNKHNIVRIVDEKNLKKKAQELNSLMQEREKLMMTVSSTIAQLDHQAHFDILTNLPNRLYFHDILKRELASAKRHTNKLAVLFLDLDKFKLINDTLGHDKGDLLLKLVADRIQGAIREEDFVAHLSGDEFALLLNNINSYKNVEAVAEKILDALKKPFNLSAKNKIYITASIGIATFPDTATTIRDLLKSADMAMYIAKNKGRDGFHLMTKMSNKKQKQTLNLANDLKFAIKQQQLFLVHQPIVELKSGIIVGFESLLRWRHPEHGIIMPADIIPLAEDTGLINTISRWVIETSIDEYLFITKKVKNKLYVSINLSAMELENEKHIKSIEETIKKSAIDKHQIMLELTETAVMRHESIAEKILTSLAKKWVNISIDDYGTGYSSLRRLSHLPIKILKIDQSFIKGIGKNKTAETIIKSTVALAKALEIDVIAEGVETASQKNFLIKNGCTYAQGFYYYKPLSTDEFIAVLLKQN